MNNGWQAVLDMLYKEQYLFIGMFGKFPSVSQLCSSLLSDFELRLSDLFCFVFFFCSFMMWTGSFAFLSKPNEAFQAHPYAEVRKQIFKANIELLRRNCENQHPD